MTDAIAKKLGESLGATAQGLRKVGETVKASGFSEALLGYQKMRVILLGQRMWTLREARQELDANWHEVAHAAREVASILLPFAEVMQAIGRLDESIASTTPADVTKRSEVPVKPSAILASVFDVLPDDEHLLKTLSVGPVSRSRLQAMLGWNSDRFHASLRRLSELNKIAQHKYGRGFRITVC